jgi:hypothetical protein
MPPLAPEVRGQLGTIGVRWAGTADPALGLGYEPPVKGGWAGAGRGVRSAMKSWWGVKLDRPPGDALSAAFLTGYVVLGLTAVPLVGASVGAIASPSAGAVEAAEAALQQAQTELWTAERLHGHVLEAAQAQTPYAFVGLPRPAPPVDDAPPPDPPARAVAAHGVGTVLELSTASLRLATEKTGTIIDPELHVTLRVWYRLLRAADSEVLYDSWAAYRSPEARTLVAWGTHGAQAFRAEVDAGTREVVAQILDRLFLAEAPAVPPTAPLPGPGE